VARGLVALTGGSGFVGSHVAEALVQAGWSVRALVRRPQSPGWLKGLEVALDTGDVRVPEGLDAFVANADAVVHAAGMTSARSPQDYWVANAGGTKNVAEAVRQAAPDAHVVLVSSLAAAGPSRDGVPVRVEDVPRPVSPYGRSKLGGETALRASGVRFSILRPSAVYGPRETAIRDLFVAASRGIVPVIGGGTPRIQLVYALDLATAVVRLVERGPRNETFFAAHPEVLDYREVAVRLAALRDPPARLVPVPAGLVRCAGAVVGWLSAFAAGPPVFNREKAEELLQPAWTCDVSGAQTALGTPFKTDFVLGAEATYAWYREAGWIAPRGRV
jgi:nucleoside-diphosphate-sugar epimerase